MRRKTRKIFYGDVAVGGNSPVSIQSMTRTELSDVPSTLRQIKLLKKKGCEIVRIAVPDIESVSYLKKAIPRSVLPIEADIHFNWNIAILCIQAGVQGIRLNPGNIYRKSQIIAVAKQVAEKNIPVRVGLNSGSLPVCAGTLSGKMVRSALNYIDILQKAGVCNIIVSLKCSDVQQTVASYRELAKKTDIPFHLGITATGFGTESIVKSSIGIGSLLLDGIGDTIRVSFSGNPVEEVSTGKYILQALRIRRFFPEVIACPTCGRCTIDVPRIAKQVYSKLSNISNNYPGILSLTVAVMGCVVNGPGEAKNADVGIAGGKGKGLLFVKGKPLYNVEEKKLADTLVKQAISLSLLATAAPNCRDK